MIAHGGRHKLWVTAFCFAAVALAAGCGADGTSSVMIPPADHSAPSVSGTVYAPDGQFASAPWWSQWADGLRLMPRAYAGLPSELPVGPAQAVSLSRFDPAAAAHGCPPQFACATLLRNGSTESDGTYVISHDLLASFHPAELIVHLGNSNKGTLTRAFILSCDTSSGVAACTANVDAVSEALVRLVLDRLTQAPAVQLYDFTSDGLQTCYTYAQTKAAGIVGTDVHDVNEKVYQQLETSPTMRKMMEEVLMAGTP